MNKFPDFKLIKNFYDKGFWNINMLNLAVQRNYLTKEEFKSITNKNYLSE